MDYWSFSIFYNMYSLLLWPRAVGWKGAITIISVIKDHFLTIFEVDFSVDYWTPMCTCYVKIKHEDGITKNLNQPKLLNILIWFVNESFKMVQLPPFSFFKFRALSLNYNMYTYCSYNIYCALPNLVIQNSCKLTQFYWHQNISILDIHN